MLQQELQACVSLIEELQANRERKKDNEAVAKKNTVFFEAYSSHLIPILYSIQAIRALENFQFSSSLLEDLRRLVLLTESFFQKKAVNDPVKYRREVSTLNNRFAEEWKLGRASDDGGMIQKLNMLKPLQSENREITQVLYCFNSINNWPINARTVENYILAKENARQLLSEMNLDSNIMAFLQKVSERKATLADIDENILAWIKREHLEGKFSLGVKELRFGV